jgi:DNA repair exonuclease SbcCD ATPase subunit
VDELSREIDEARVRCEKLDREARERERLETRLVALRVEAERLGEIVDEVESTEVEPCEDLGARLYEIEKRKSALSLAVSIAATNLTKANQALVCLDVARKKHSDVKVEEDLLREAGQVLTKAQQAVKETVLANIEQLANKMLESADIPLRVEFSWSQETKGLAKVCDCGVAFPDSKRVKSCPACKVPRGNATTHKLQIELSNTSGAAEDLGGLSLGIGAALWLRARRGIRWSCAFIDEPFGALDFHNKDALGTHVLGMLSQSFSSAFVVAHDRSILSSMPSRVEIVSGPNGSRIRRV